MVLRKIFPAILYLFVIGSALSEETRDLVTDTITVKDSFIDSRIIKFPATVETYNDHRMAMSFSVLGLKSSGITINDPGCVAKTFPDFFKRLELLHA